MAFLVSNRGFANSQISVDALTAGSHFTQISDSRSGGGGPGVSTQDSASAAGSATVFSGGAPFPPVGTQAGSANAFASAQEGTLRAGSGVDFATSKLAQNSGVSRASATARWSDFLTVTGGAGLTGTRGMIDAEIDVSGNVSGGFNAAGGGDSAAAFESVARFMGSGLAAFASYPNDMLGNCQGWTFCAVERGDLSASAGFSNFVDTIVVSIPVIFGSQFGIDYTLDVTSLANAITADLGLAASAIGVSNFSSTIRWAGITGVFDANGNRLSDVSVTSQSGFDYLAHDSAPVSSPSTLWCLLMCGFVLARSITKQGSNVMSKLAENIAPPRPGA